MHRMILNLVYPDEFKAISVNKKSQKNKIKVKQKP